jgi:DNA-binding NtrC family response regulator
MSHDTILVVDDDPAILEVVTELLELEGYSVTTATNGREALSVLTSVTPCVMLLDMRMPIMDGWALSNEMKKRGIALPVVVMTAAQNAKAWAEEVAAAAFLAKPFHIGDVLATVKRFCAGHPGG